MQPALGVDGRTFLGRDLDKQTATSAAGAAVTLTVGADWNRRVIQIMVNYSASATGIVTINYVSAATSITHQIWQLTFNASTEGVWLPDADVEIGPADQLTVVAFAGGGAIVATIEALFEILGPAFPAAGLTASQAPAGLSGTG